MGWTQLVSSSSTFNSSASSSFTYNLPGGAPPGGVIEVLFFCGDEQVTAAGAGGGAAWTKLQTYAGNMGSELYYRVTNGSEGSSIVLTLQTATAGFAQSVQYQRWSGQAASPLDISNTANNGGAAGGTSTPALSTGTLAGTGELLLEFGGLWGTTGGPPTSPVWTDSGAVDSGNGPAQIASSGGDGFSVASYCAYNTNAGTGAVTVQVAFSSWSLSPSGDLDSMFVAFKAAPPTSGPPLAPEYMQRPPAVIVSGAGWRGANHSR